MGLFVKQENERSQLQQKIAADIAERQRARDAAKDTPPDGVDDSRLVEGTSHLSRTGLVILIVLILAVVAGIVFASTR